MRTSGYHADGTFIAIGGDTGLIAKSVGFLTWCSIVELFQNRSRQESQEDIVIMVLSQLSRWPA
jgi:hypothetical protein